MKEPNDIHWLNEPETQDYTAALSYLSLTYSDHDAAGLVAELKIGSIVRYKAKDIFRASGLSLLGVSNKHVEHDKEKIADGKSLSPILLVRERSRLVIADGYHRLCAVYSVDEDALIPCRIAGTPS